MRMLYARFLLVAIWILPSLGATAELDFDRDGVYSCGDIELLQTAIRTGNQESQWDVNGDGSVAQGIFDLYVIGSGPGNGDIVAWLYDVSQETDQILLRAGDVSLDGFIQHDDYLVVAAKSQLRVGDRAGSVSGWCEGDFDGDLLVTGDDEFHANNRYNRTSYKPREPAAVTLVRERVAGGGQVFARTELYDLIAYPESSSPDGFSVTRVSARMHDATHDIVTIDSLVLDGGLHQVRAPFGDTPYSTNLEQEQWRTYDSHVTIVDRHNQVNIATEDNDGSDPLKIAAQLESDRGVPTVGLGVTDLEFSPFYVNEGHHEIEIARLVKPLNTPADPITLSIAIQGVDQDLAVLPDVGRVQPVVVPFLNCDFDGDQSCSVGDLDMLVHAIGMDDLQLDLTPQSSTVINAADVDTWLRLASANQDPLRRGDANLDGRVDAEDLNALALNWNQPDNNPGWSGGDFNGDGNVTSTDLNQLARNWQASAAATAPVPEPSAIALLEIVLMICLACRRR